MGNISINLAAIRFKQSSHMKMQQYTKIYGAIISCKKLQHSSLIFLSFFSSKLEPLNCWVQTFITNSFCKMQKRLTTLFIFDKTTIFRVKETCLISALPFHDKRTVLFLSIDRVFYTFPKFKNFPFATASIGAYTQISDI